MAASSLLSAYRKTSTRPGLDAKGSANALGTKKCIVDEDDDDDDVCRIWLWLRKSLVKDAFCVCALYGVARAVSSELKSRFSLKKEKIAKKNKLSSPSWASWMKLCHIKVCFFK